MRFWEKLSLHGMSNPISFSKNFKLAYLGISLTQTFPAISFNAIETTVHTNTVYQSSSGTVLIYSTNSNLQLTCKITRNYISRDRLIGNLVSRGSQKTYFVPEKVAVNSEIVKSLQ